MRNGMGELYCLFYVCFSVCFCFVLTQEYTLAHRQTKFSPLPARLPPIHSPQEPNLAAGGTPLYQVPGISHNLNLTYPVHDTSQSSDLNDCWLLLKKKKGFMYTCLSVTKILRVPDQNGISQACFIVEIYHSGPEPSICPAPH